MKDKKYGKKEFDKGYDFGAIVGMCVTSLVYLILFLLGELRYWFIFIILPVGYILFYIIMKKTEMKRKSQGGQAKCQIKKEQNSNA